MTEKDYITGSLTPGARQLVRSAEEAQRTEGCAELCLNHWFIALAENNVSIGLQEGTIAKYLSAAQLRKVKLKEKFKEDIPDRCDKVTIAGTAIGFAIQSGREMADERDLAAQILIAAEITLYGDISTIARQGLKYSN